MGRAEESKPTVPIHHRCALIDIGRCISFLYGVRPPVIVCEIPTALQLSKLDTNLDPRPALDCWASILQFRLGCHRCHRLNISRVPEIGEATIWISYIIYIIPRILHPVPGTETSTAGHAARSEISRPCQFSHAAYCSNYSRHLVMTTACSFPQLSTSNSRRRIRIR